MRSDELPPGQLIDYDAIRAKIKIEVEQEYLWVVAALLQRIEGRAIRISFREVLLVSPRARIERYEDPEGHFIEYRLRDD